MTIEQANNCHPNGHNACLLFWEEEKRETERGKKEERNRK